MNELVVASWSMTEAAAAHLSDVSMPLLAAGLALHVLKLGARARAWQNVLRVSFPERRVGYRDAAVPYFAGVGAGVIVPLGGGEVLRVALARARLRTDEGGTSTATIVGSLAVEKALDFGVALLVIACAATVGALPNGALHGRLAAGASHPLAAAVVAGIVLAAASGCWYWRRPLAASARRLVRGLAVLRRPGRYLTTVASWQLLSWALRFAAIVAFLYAFHVPGALAVAPIVLSLQLLAGAIPFTPGGAGTQQALMAAALGSAAVVGFSAGTQAATMLVDLALGTAALASCGIRPSLRVLRPAAVTALL
jgi:uncharacterized membrane protein YbhN (UPF0104 family)